MSTLILIVIVVAYILGIRKFWKGFDRTSFASTLPNKLILSLLWPVLIVANKYYRKNFQKALKGK